MSIPRDEAPHAIRGNTWEEMSVGSAFFLPLPHAAVITANVTTMLRTGST